MLHNLRVRFLNQNAIYTWCGIVLVAVNPFCELNIYGEQAIQTYHQSIGSAQLDPHIYAVAEDAYSKLERESRNQSIIVSGESGAGKTVSAKYAMRYFASIAGSDSSNIEQKVLASNPIMEAIGNAKTIRNDNSSRFGKYIQISFDPYSRRITGGHMSTYLLEKSRIAYQGEQERNFHIFYQFRSYCQQQGLRSYSVDDPNTFFAYLGDSDHNDNVPNGDSMDLFLEALQTLGFNEKQQQVIFKVLAAILHAGNVEFEAVDEEQCRIPNQDAHLAMFCQLLNLEPEAAKKWFTQRVLRSCMREVIITPMSVSLAKYGRDALAKFMYEKMFYWIVTNINRSLAAHPSSNVTERPSSGHFIGVLDIYGFEHFEQNSFEQFCINYANEALQQQFNQHVFKLEQEEYVRENIDWTFITFTDNQPVITLIEAKPIGILNLLDEECKMPKGDDRSWCAKLYSQLPQGDCFLKPKFGADTSFIVQHFADKVIYRVDGFLEKNRDTVWEEQIDLLRRSAVLDCLFLTEEDSASAAGGKVGGKLRITPQKQQRQSKMAKATVGSQFRESLASLMSILNATTPHYVRCIKPNDVRGAFLFNNQRTVQQLRACGVLETVRISSNGFPSRWTYSDFANRYRVFLVGLQRRLKVNELSADFVKVKSSALSEATPLTVGSGQVRKLLRTDDGEAKRQCVEIVRVVYELQLYGKEFRGQGLTGQDCVYQFGKSKIFFRAGQVALLERIRAQLLRDCALLLQRCVRGWLVRRHYTSMREAVLQLQRFGRGWLARKHLQHLRQQRAAIRIQCYWRAYVAQKRYEQLRRCANCLQRYARGYLARIKTRRMRQELAAIRIQRHWRGYLIRQKAADYHCKVVVAQCAIRRYLAVKRLKQLRIEARSIAHVQTLNKGLEGKIIQLQQRIELMKVELQREQQAAHVAQDARTEKARLEHELRLMRQQLQTSQRRLNELETQLEERRQDCAKLRLEAEQARYGEQQLNARLAELQATNNAAALDAQLVEREKILAGRFERERRMLLDERETEKEAHQRLLRKYAALEEKLQASRMRSSFDEEDAEIDGEHVFEELDQAEQLFEQQLHNNEMSPLDKPPVQGSDGLTTATVLDETVANITPAERRSRTRSGGQFDLSTVSLMMRCSELEQERAKLKHENQEMRDALADKLQDGPSRGAALLAQQCAQLQAELDRAREERSQLKTIVLGQECGRGPSTESEVVAAFKCIIRQLEQELKQERSTRKSLEESGPASGSLSSGISSAGSSTALASSNGSSNGNMSSLVLSNVEQQQLVRLSQEKLLLQQKCDQLGEENSRLRLELLRRNVVGVGDENYYVGESGDNGVNNRYLGMFEFSQQNVPLLMKILVYDLEPSVGLKFPPHYPAYIVYMCVRYCDYINDDQQIRVLLNGFLLALKRRIRKNLSLDVYVLWLANLCTFITCLKQFSGDELYGTFEESLQNFDLSEYRQIFTDNTVYIYHSLLRICEDRIQPLIVPAVLEYEGLATSGIYSQPSNMHRSDSRMQEDPSAKPVELLVTELSDLYQLLRLHVVQPEIIFLIFKQLFYFICSGALNNLLLRKDLCHWNKVGWTCFGQTFHSFYSISTNSLFLF